MPTRWPNGMSRREWTLLWVSIGLIVLALLGFIVMLSIAFG